VTTILSNVLFSKTEDKETFTAAIKVVKNSDNTFQAKLFKNGKEICNSPPVSDKIGEANAQLAASRCAVHFAAELNREGYAVLTT
jgi:hypothetical protein